MIQGIWMGKWLLLFCSFGGWLYLAKKRLRAEGTFLPLFVLSSIALAVYFGGLAGLLPQAAYAVFLGGLLCSIFGIVSCLRTRPKPAVPSLFFCAFFVCAAAFLAFLFFANFEHYDNFSHWAIVVKQMLCTDAFPTSGSVMIEFRNYPLGASSLLYYVCRMTDHREGTMLFAQGLLIFACFYAMFGIIREKKRFLLYSFLGAGCGVLTIFNLSIRMDNLLVDFLLPLLALAALAIACRYRRDASPVRTCVLLAPVLGLLTVVKATGVLFAVLVLLVAGWWQLRRKPALRQALPMAGCILFSLLPIVLWQLHEKLAFPDAVNKFELSAGALTTGYAAKTTEQLHAIVRLFLRTIFDPSSRAAWGIAGFQLAAMAACFFAAHILHKKWRLKKALVVLDAVVVAYYAGILAMYLFSMPADEALALAGWERYASSMVIFFGGALLLCAVVDWEDSFAVPFGTTADYKAFYSVASKKRYQAGVVATTLLGAALLLSEYNGLAYLQGQYAFSFPAKIEAIVGDRWDAGGAVDESRYLLYASDTNGQMTDYYVQYVTRYFLFAPHVDGVCSFYEDNFVHLLSAYDYLIIGESDFSERYLMRKYFGVEGEPGVYSVPELLRGASLPAS